MNRQSLAQYLEVANFALGKRKSNLKNIDV